MNREMLMLVEAISREKNVERDVVFGAVEAALARLAAERGRAVAVQRLVELQRPQLERADAPGEGVCGQLRLAAQGFGIGVLALEMLGSEEEPFGPQGLCRIHGDRPIGCIERPPARPSRPRR